MIDMLCLLDLIAKESGTIKFMPTQNIDNKTGMINGNEKVCQIFDFAKCVKKGVDYILSIQVNLPKSLVAEFFHRLCRPGGSQ